MADRNGDAFRRRLCSAARLSDSAMRRALCCLKMSGSRSRALLVAMTLADHLRAYEAPVRRPGGALRRALFIAE